MSTNKFKFNFQVTKETAAVLEQNGVKCHLRGETWVKPKGLVTTYFVGIDDERHLQRVEPVEETNL